MIVANWIFLNFGGWALSFCGGLKLLEDPSLGCALMFAGFCIAMSSNFNKDSAS